VYLGAPKHFFFFFNKILLIKKNTWKFDLKHRKYNYERCKRADAIGTLKFLQWFLRF